MQQQLSADSLDIGKSKRMCNALLNLRGWDSAFAKSIDPCQPAQSAQADVGRNFSHSSRFLHYMQTKGPLYRLPESILRQNGFFEILITCYTKMINIH